MHVSYDMKHQCTCLTLIVISVSEWKKNYEVRSKWNRWPFWKAKWPFKLYFFSWVKRMKKMSKKIVENGPQCFIPRELVIFEFFLFELVHYSVDRDVSSDWTKMILLLLLLDNYWHYLEFISHNFVDKRQNNRNFLMICLSFCSAKCVIKVIPSHSCESLSVREKAVTY